MGGQLGNWLIENKIIEHIFGPNLHVEVFFVLHIHVINSEQRLIFY